MSLLSVAELKAQVRTSLSDADLQQVINREEADVIRLYGGHYVDASTTVSETLHGGSRNLYLRRGVTTVVGVTEYLTLEDTTGAALTTTEHHPWSAEGRIERLPSTAISQLLGGGGVRWGEAVTVVYVPADDNDLRKAVIIDLCRLALERTAMQSESVAGEYSYTAPKWAEARAEILHRLGFIGV